MFILFCNFTILLTIDCFISSNDRKYSQSVDQNEQFKVGINVTCRNIEKLLVEKLGLDSFYSFFINLYDTVSNYWNNFDFGGN
jgi:hypothetical protein